ncbi:glycosyltransferase [Candidatus Woesearchaeota archaeon]|nr:glycosyltransferase [Candidatus Woesearchaeota archaeon]
MTPIDAVTEVSRDLFPNRRVLLIAHEFETGGGIATYVRHTKKALRSLDLMVDVLVRAHGSSSEASLFTDDVATSVDINNLPQLLKRRPYDLIHFNSISTTTMYGFPLRGLGILNTPLVYTAHSSIQQEMDRLGVGGAEYQRALEAQHQLLDIADRIIVPSTALGGALGGQSKIRVVPNPVALPTFEAKNVDAIANWIRKHYAPNDEDLLIYSGRLGQEKGVTTLAAAYNHLKRQRTNLRLLYVGAGPATPTVYQILGADCDGFIKDGSGRKYPPVTGWRQGEELFAYYAAADAIIIPSKLESFGLSAAEALLMKKPLIVSDIDGPHEYFVEPGFAYGISNPNDVSAIIQATNRCLAEKGTSSQRAMIDRAVAHLTSELNLGSFGKRVLRTYAESIGNTTRRRHYYHAAAAYHQRRLEELLTEEPDNGAIAYALAEMYASHGETSSAQQLLERAMTCTFTASYGVEKQQAYVALAALYYKKREYHLLPPLFKEGSVLLEHDKVDAYKKAVVDDWYEFGIKAREARDLVLSQYYFNLILETDPNHGNAHHRIAQTIKELGGEDARMREHYDYALALRAEMFPEEFMTGFASEATRGSSTRTYHNEITLYRFNRPRIIYATPKERRALSGFVVKKVMEEGDLRTITLQRAKTEFSTLELLATSPQFQDHYRVPLPLAYDPTSGIIVMELVQGRSVPSIVAQNPTKFVEYMERIASFAAELHEIRIHDRADAPLTTNVQYSLYLNMIREDNTKSADPAYRRIKEYLECGASVPTGRTQRFIHGDQSIAVFYDTGAELYCIDFNNADSGLPSQDAALLISNAYTHMADVVPLPLFRNGVEHFLELYTKKMGSDEKAAFSRQLPFFLAGAEYSKVSDLGLGRVDYNIREIYGITLK